MWSLELTAQAAPDDHSASEALDALERLAVNAMPAGLSDDLWSHPYLQFPNSFQARPMEQDRVWPPPDGPNASMYGLAPNYECCAANQHQGWPKLTANLFFSVPGDNTLVSTLWMPSIATAPEDVGGGATVELRTDYPFGLSAEYIVSNSQAFTLKIHVPTFLREAAGPSEGLATLRA